MGDKSGETIGSGARVRGEKSLGTHTSEAVRRGQHIVVQRRPALSIRSRASCAPGSLEKGSRQCF